MRGAPAALAVAAILLWAAGAGGQIRRQGTGPPNAEGRSSRPATPRIQTPSEEVKGLLESARYMRTQASGYRVKADELRDTNHYDDADALEERADELETRAVDFERRAEREQMKRGSFRPVE